jgi:hypothetical protein
VSPAFLITGFASVTSSGVQRGLPEAGPPILPQRVTQWPTPGPRWACMVPPFRATDVVPGLRTRRMDRLSVWGLVSGSLVFQTAGIDPSTIDPDRTGVVCGSALGCLERTQDFLAAVAQDAARADPILFPETLSNLVAGHVARHFGLKGPNLTVMAGALSGETALMEAAAILASGAADRILVLAGDSLTRPLYEYFEAAGMLDPACFDADPREAPQKRHRQVPGEGLVACLLETRKSAAARNAVVFGRYLGSWIGTVEPREQRQNREDEPLSGPFACDGAAIFESSASRADSDGGISWSLTLSDIVAAALRPLASGSRMGSFGGAGLWNVGEALALARMTTADAILATNVDACRSLAAATCVARGDCS